MAITQFIYDMDIISKLSDSPNVDDGLTATQLKAKFDEAGKVIKDYINMTLLSEVAEKPVFYGLVKHEEGGFVPAEAGEDYQKPLGPGDVMLDMLGEDVTPAGLGAAVPSTAVEVTLAGWEENAVAVDVPAVTGDSHVIVTPHPDSYVLWSECLVRAVKQEAGKLYFACEDLPEEDIKANVLIVG